MLAAATKAVLHVVALVAALQLAAFQLWQEALGAVAATAVEGVGKGASRCLRTALGLLTGHNEDDGSLPHGQQHPLHFLTYASTAAARLAATAATAFHEKSYWTATAMLDLSALWAVWRRHKEEHAEAAAAASVRRAAADPANTATHMVPQPARQTDLPLLRRAAAHSNAAYGAHAAKGEVSSALGYLQLITIGQATGKAPRHIPHAAHLAAVQQLTGCPPSDVLAGHWQSHLHRPAYYVALDRAAGRVVVCVRGTLQLGDFCTVLDAVPQPITLCGVAGHVHGGFLAAARNLLPPVAAALRAAAQQVPGWPVLVTGHSLGGGVAAVLAMLLADQRQRAEQEAEEGRHCQQLPDQSEQQQDSLQQLGQMTCIGVGAAAAFSQPLGMACHDFVTSVLYGMDCLPMFSVLGARLLIEEVHAKSKAAALVSGILRRARSSRGGAGVSSRSHSRASSLGGDDTSGVVDVLDRTTSAASSEQSEIEEAVPCAGEGGSRLRRCSSAWSSASTASIAAFVSDTIPAGRGSSGASLVPMFPPGRILWMLPDEKRPDAPPQLVETDQTAFKRFLFSVETTHHHLPDTYTDALAQLDR